MRKTHLFLIYFGIVFFIIIPSTQAILSDQTEVFAGFNFNGNYGKAYTRADNYTISWSWVTDNIYYVNGTIQTMNVTIYSSMDLQKNYTIFVWQLIDISDVESNFFVDFMNYTTSREQQIFAIKFSLSYNNSLNQPNSIYGFYKIIWNPRIAMNVNTNPIKIPIYIIPLIVVLGGGLLAYYIYNIYVSCDNENNFNSDRCKRKYHDELKQQEEITSQLTKKQNLKTELFKD